MAAPAARLTAPGDLSGDGLPDRVVLDTTGRLWLYQGRPGGTFASAPQELTQAKGTAAVNWDTVGGLSIVPATSSTSQPVLEVTEVGEVHRFVLGQDGVLTPAPSGA
ncbi:hypothetical protein DN069_37555 [Streptacidiphilus pinicola]|uniref:VCBS repeat-containing protein n=1 Tax=Streptacidiphilus pinicola TaxID=2219663 RepID=A0A2X0I6F8_9ACTN|nr:hypothetical protein [Streptacidiphilus pinicola]RAG80562.1 hypothetical protein DN069_37555 [Streptacidiphilus pinicola]